LSNILKVQSGWLRSWFGKKTIIFSIKKSLIFIDNSHHVFEKVLKANDCGLTNCFLDSASLNLADLFDSISLVFLLIYNIVGFCEVYFFKHSSIIFSVSVSIEKEKEYNSPSKMKEISNVLILEASHSKCFLYQKVDGLRF
jgi:hypothetical protein